MGLVTLTLPNDGESIDAADVNNPLNTLATAINGNLDSNNIADSAITNSKMEASIRPQTRWDEGFYDFVASGGVWSVSSGLTGAMTSAVIYVDGIRISVSAVGSKVFTASKDTYVDIGTDGTVDYTEVSNNAASPSLAASHIRVAIIVTSGAAITNINQGDPAEATPVASSIIYSVQDSLGNLIYNRTPTPGLIGYRQVTSGQAITSTGNGQVVTGLSCPVIIPTGRRIKITGHIYALTTNGSAAASTGFYLWEGSVGGTQLNGFQVGGVSNESTNGGSHVEAISSPTAGAHTYLVSCFTTTGTAQTNASATLPAFISVELV